MHHVVLGLYIDKEGKETYDSDDGGVLGIFFFFLLMFFFFLLVFQVFALFKLVSHPYTPIEINDEELVFSIKVTASEGIPFTISLITECLFLFDPVTRNNLFFCHYFPCRSIRTEGSPLTSRTSRWARSSKPK